MSTAQKVAHTPGPWEYAPSPYFPAHTIYRNGINIARVTEARGTQFDGLEPTPLVTEANARLIAAAPDLLAALEGMSDAVVGHDLHCFEGDFREAVLNVRAAIAKARGA